MIWFRDSSEDRWCQLALTASEIFYLHELGLGLHPARQETGELFPSRDDLHGNKLEKLPCFPDMARANVHATQASSQTAVPRSDTSKTLGVFSLGWWLVAGAGLF
jgi:hypothetical protein